MRTQRLAVFLSLALMAVALCVVPAGNASSPPSPAFWVSQDYNSIAGGGWPAGDPLTVTADDPETVAAPDITVNYLVTNAEGNFDGMLQVLPGLQPGWFITVTDGVTTKTHTVGTVSITEVNLATEEIRGTADPFTDVYTGSAYGGAGTMNLDFLSTPLNGKWTVADSSGMWSADLSGVYDITPASQVGALQMDADGDFTYTQRYLGPAKFGVGLNGAAMVGDGWPADVGLTATADDPETMQAPDYTVTLTTNGQGSFFVNGFSGLQPGWFVTVTDGAITKTHTARDISITDVVPATDVMSGTADPFTDVWVGGDGPGERVSARADSSGMWSADLSGAYDITPGKRVGALQIDADGDFTHVGQLVAIAPIPPGTSLTTPSHGTATSGAPGVFWNDPLTVSTTGCSGGTATSTLTLDDGYTETITLTVAPPGTYAGTFAAPFPHHGWASISISIGGCSPATTIEFNVYIDPSGVVRDTFGRPVVGATVTLFRSDAPGGPFLAVPDGSPLMGPGNRTNPDLTVAGGLFGWDVVAGFYKVQAEKAGCSSPDGGAFVETGVLTIPPPATGLALVLYCPAAADTTPPALTVPASITVDATKPSGAAVAYTATATDNTDPSPIVTCTPPSGTTFAIGNTTVTCTATDAAGNRATASFTVHVKGAAGQLADLAAAVKGVGPGKSLSATVAVAQLLLAHGQIKAACLTLTVFNLEVRAQAGKKIPTPQATALIAEANRIKTVLGCTK